jgi:hypothetical protein
MPGSSQKPASLSRTSPPLDNPADSHLPLDSADNVDPETVRQERLAQLFVLETRKKNIADSETLIALARELSAEYEKPGPSKASSIEFNKVKEIEKLAKRVKQRLIEQSAQ